MSRRHLSFSCEGDRLVGTLDHAPANTGLLIVSGGNEIRSGAYAGQARMAEHFAGQGYAVFRYDRRGVGDSDGLNRGFRGGGPDLAAAVAAFREAVPGLTRIIAFGNCDGATTLALHGVTLPISGMVLANPWIIDGDEAPPELPAAAIRARYLEKLVNPRELLRLVSGGVNLRKLAGGLRRAARSSSEAPVTLVQDMHQRLGSFDGPVRILLAERDRTAQLFQEAWPADDLRIRACPSRSHSFSDGTARQFLFENLREALAG